MSKRKNGLSYSCASEIREYWRTSGYRRYFDVPTIKVDSETGVISSNMVDGWPPKR